MAVWRRKVSRRTLRTGSWTSIITTWKHEEVNASIDTLETILTDPAASPSGHHKNLVAEQAMEYVCGAGSHAEYADRPDISEQLDSLIAQQDSLLSTPHIRRKVITHHNSLHHSSQEERDSSRGWLTYSAPGKKIPPRWATWFRRNTGYPGWSVQSDRYHQRAWLQAFSTGISRPTKKPDAKHPHQQPARHWKRTESAYQPVAGKHWTRWTEPPAPNWCRREEIRKEAAETMAKIAIAAFVLVLVFSIVIARDITLQPFTGGTGKSEVVCRELAGSPWKLMLTITPWHQGPGFIIGYIDLLIRLVNDRRQQFYLSNMKVPAGNICWHSSLPCWITTAWKQVRWTYIR